jgi:formylglycine-generating enzyme required for sulfatase activity
MQVFVLLVLAGAALFSGNAAAPLRPGMVLVHAAKDSFQMGFAVGVQNWACITGKHKVSFTYDFFVDTTLVTQADYTTIMKNNPSSHKITGNLRLPVEKVSWFDAVLYCNARSKRDGLDTVYTFSAITYTGTSANNLVNLTFTANSLKKNGYRLLTNAEAEYCVRAHSTGMWWWTNTTDANQATTDANLYVVWSGNDGGTTQPVASKKPNSFGLYDMTGNLFEWSNDWEAPYGTAPEIDPIGAAASNAPACTTWDAGGNQKMARGGSFKNDCNYHGRTPYHFKWTANAISQEVGFRCAATSGVGVGVTNSIIKSVSSNTVITSYRLYTKIECFLEAQSAVSISIVDYKGKTIKTIYTGEMPAGKYRAVWNGKTNKGNKVGAGLYMVSVKINDGYVTKPFTLLQ